MDQNRARTDLNGKWWIFFDREDLGITTTQAPWFLADTRRRPARELTQEPPVGHTEDLVSPDKTEFNRRFWARVQAEKRAIRIPSVWQELEPGYAGAAWYWRTFDCRGGRKGQRAFLRFGAVAYFCEVWLNGRLAGRHEGGYLPFELEVTGRLQPGENRLALRVIDPGEGMRVAGLSLGGWKEREIPASKEGRWGLPFSGIWQGVSLERRPAVHLAGLFLRPEPARKRVTAEVSFRNPGEAVPGRLRLKISSWPDGAAAAPARTWDITVSQRDSRLVFELPFPAFEYWSPEQPRLYRLEAELTPAGAEPDRLEERFGMREFTVRGDRFLLNGRPIFIRSTLYQGNFPVGLAVPPDPNHCRRQVELAKGCGLNMLRVHVRPAHPDLLDAADELGMLLYEEPAIAWMGDTPYLEERCRSEVAEMVRRDRNRPSVVLWGMINEGGGVAARLKGELSRLARELDPTRPVIDDSGGVQFGQPYLYLPGRDRPVPVNDTHPYHAIPVSDDSWKYFTTVGKPGKTFVVNKRWNFSLTGARNRLTFVSELGYGDYGFLPEVLEGYRRRRAWKGLNDYRIFAGIWENLAGEYRRLGLEESFGPISRFLSATHAVHAEGNSRMIEGILINPWTAGYTLTFFEEASWECTGGLVTLWNQPKDLMFAAGKRLNADRVLVLEWGPRNFYAGREREVTAWLVDQTRTPHVGRVRLSLTAGGKSAAGELAYRSRGRRIERIGAWQFRAPETAGFGTLLGRLETEGFRWIPAEYSVFVGPAGQLAGLRARTARLPEELRGRLAGSGLAEGAGPILLDGANAAPKDVQEILAEVENGAAAVIFNPDRVAEKLPFPVNYQPARGWAFPCLHFLEAHPLFAGGRGTGAAGEPFTGVVPYLSADSAGLPAGVRTAGGCLRYSMHGRISSGRDILELRLGKGRLILNSYRLPESIGRDPLAEKLLANLLNYAGAAKGR